MSQTATYITPVIKSDQTTAIPSHKVIYYIKKTLTKITDSDMWVDLEQIDNYIAFLHSQMEVFTAIGDSENQSKTDSALDLWNTWRSYIQANLDELGYVENP